MPVSDADGVAVTGLTAANFTVDAKLVGPFGSSVEIEQPNQGTSRAAACVPG